MKKYDYKKAKKLIESTPNVISAELGMYEDWWWTADIVYEDGSFRVNLEKKELKIGGITGSSWATPALRLEFKDGSVKMISIYKGESEDHRCPIGDLGLGAMSGPIQNNLPPLEDQGYYIPKERHEKNKETNQEIL